MSTIAPNERAGSLDDAGVDHEASQSKQPSPHRVFIPVLVMLVGLAVLLYPVVATQWNNWLQDKVSAEYQHELDSVENMQPSASDMIAAAQLYNERLTNGPILDPWLARISADNAAYQDYLSQLSGLSAMSNVVIPSIDSRLPVFHGTSEATLQKGVGHLYGSSLPVGGEGTHAVLTGHTGLTNATLWDNLTDLKAGDAIYLSTFGERMKYEVHDTEVVLPHETESLETVPGKDLLTLITCTPYGVNTHRLLVHAHRVEMDPAEASVFEKPGMRMQWWMWLVVAVAVLAIAGMARWVATQRRQTKFDAINQEEV